MRAQTATRFGRVVISVGTLALALSACAKKADDSDDAGAPAAGTVASAPAAAGPAAPGAPAATASAAAVAADNTDTLGGVKYASYTGDATKGAADFQTCMTCHAIEAGVNKIGPSLHNVVGRHSGSIANFAYSAANKNSGIVWTPEKLFQYLESPQRVVPGTKMSFAGWSDPQKRADVIAYLKANSPGT